MQKYSPDSQLGTSWYSLFDWSLFILTILISCIGILFIYSATFSSESEFLRGIYTRQIEWMIYGLIILCLFAAVDYRLLERPAYLLYFIMILLLLQVLFNARVISGSARWLSMGGMNIKPSEIMKVALIIMLARFFDDSRDRGDIGFKQLFKPTLIALIPAIIIAKQPDMGTAVIIMFIFVAMAFTNGIKKKTLLAITVSTVVAIPMFWFSLKNYQKDRILAMLDPSSDPLGIGYHTIQSKIAIGSGGLLGQGLFAGTQSKLNFLPEKHTDFIFSVFSEEVGFVGVIILLLLYLFMLLRMMDIVLKASDRGGSLMAVGGAAMIAFHFFYNVGMTLGITPIVGIPMPFFSYGGSSLIANYMIIGIMLSVHMRRFRHD